MIRKLHIANFKAWKDTHEIRVAPLTIFCGNNSSGKSSIAQLLLMLKQTVESYDRQRVLNLGDKDSITDLGSYSDIIHNHNIGERLSFNIEFKTEGITFSNVKTSEKYGPYNSLNFNADVGYDDSLGRVVLEQMKYVLKKVGKVPIQFTFKRSKNKYIFDSQGYTLVKRKMRQWDLPS